MKGLRRVSSDSDVDLDRYAEISAHVRHFPAEKKDEVVARLGVPPRDWQAVSARWSTDVDASVDSGQADLVQRYSAAFARAKRRLASLRPSIESLGPLPEPDVSAAAEPVPEPAIAGAPEPAEPQVAVPSYMSNPSAGGPAVPGFMRAASWAPPEPLAAAAAPVAPPPAAVAIAEEPLIRTSVAAPAPVVTPPAAAAQVPAPARPATARPRTIALPVMPVPMEELPFKAVEGSAEEAVERAVAHAGAVQRPVPEKPIALDTTADIGAIARGPLPFARSAKPPSPKPIPQYTIERYASLRVELTEYADRAADVLARYNLDGETARALEDDWKWRMNADSALRSRFLDACDRYRIWLRSSAANKR